MYPKSGSRAPDPDQHGGASPLPRVAHLLPHPYPTADAPAVEADYTHLACRVCSRPPTLEPGCSVTHQATNDAEAEALPRLISGRTARLKAARQALTTTRSTARA